MNSPKHTPSELIEIINNLIERYARNASISGVAIFKPKMIPPEYLFKYTSIDASLKILSNNSFRYSQREILDDVFEENLNRDEILKILPGFEDGPTLLISTYDNEENLARFDKILSIRAEMRNNGEAIDDDITIINPTVPTAGDKKNHHNKILSQKLEDIKRPLALSLTENINSKTMWALYGDNHKGVCLALNSRSIYFISNRDRISSPGYFSPITYRPLTAEDYAFRFPSERFFIKTEDWKEQREWRRVEYVTNNSTRDWKNDIHTFSFPSEVLNSIIFGVRCNNSDIEKIVNLVKSKPEFKHVVFYKTKRALNNLIHEEISE